MTLAARIADAEVVLAAVLALTFAATYTRSEWRSTRPGRSVMYLILALASVLLLGTATSLFGEQWCGRQPTRALIFGALILTLLGMLRALRAEQRRR